SLALMAATVVIGVGAAFVLVPQAAFGPAMLQAAAIATSLGMVTGFLSAMVYLRLRMGGNIPAKSALRVAAAGTTAVLVGHFLPGHGKLVGIAITLLVAIIYLAVLIALGEFGPEDRAKVKRILRLG